MEVIISIHASRMGCDQQPALPRIKMHIFQSTHPVWDATRDIANEYARCLFQSTHPVWDATDVVVSSDLVHGISIHASRMGCDAPAPPAGTSCRHFNPRIPYGMRLREWTLHSIIWKFLPALRADYIADIPEHLSVCIFGL